MYKTTKSKFFFSPTAIRRPALGLMIVLICGCGGGSPIELGPEFRQAVDAGASRDSKRIEPFLTSTDPDARAYAWRSLAFAIPARPGVWIDQALQPHAPADAWHALARVPLPDSLRRGLVETVRAGLAEALERSDDADLLQGMCQFLGVQGTVEDAGWLLDRFDAAAMDRAPRCALAVGMLAVAGEPAHDDLMQIAARTGDVRTSEAAKGLAYAFSRTARHRPEPGASLHEALAEAWQRHGVGRDPELDAWMIRGLGVSALEIVWSRAGGNGIASETVRAMEVARAARDLPFGGADGPAETHLAMIEALLNHPNPAVSVMLADGLAARFAAGGMPEPVRMRLEARLAHAPSDMSGAGTGQDRAASPPASDPELRLALVQALAAPLPDSARRDWLRDRLPALTASLDRNPYLAARMAPLWTQTETPTQTLDRFASWLEQGGVLAVQAVTGLPTVWAELPEGSRQQERFTAMVRRAIEQGERGPAFQAEPLLMDPSLFPLSDAFDRWFTQTVLDTYRLPFDIEVYQMAERVLDARGGADPIREVMRRQGTTGAVLAEEDGLSADSQKTGDRFHAPSWSRLEALGTRPALRLQTEKGLIVVRLETLTAPFTVSAIGELAARGAYDGVPFHRVVANFVIQGGDVESADGFGGPGFTLPTEISPRTFRRGRLGIASAGPDTEGSQYFIMHAWAPHLDGRYSSLGQVEEGLDVVDAIRIGDRVLKATLAR